MSSFYAKWEAVLGSDGDAGLDFHLEGGVEVEGEALEEGAQHDHGLVRRQSLSNTISWTLNLKIRYKIQEKAGIYPSENSFGETIE